MSVKIVTRMKQYDGTNIENGKITYTPEMYYEDIWITEKEIK
jgi:hypothetical protein